MKKMKRGHILLNIFLVVAFLGVSATSSQAGSVYLWATGDGDGTRHVNTRYGADGYVTGGDQMTAYLQMNAPYGNDYGYIFIEIPLGPILGETLTSAILQLDSTGTWTGYYYGSAYVRHLDPGANMPTGNTAADNPNAWGADASWTIYDTYADPPWNGSAGLKSFDVTTLVQADLTAGRAYSTFMLDASRDTYCTIYASETSGQGPRLYAEGDFDLAPLPGAAWLLGSGLAGLAFCRKRWALFKS